MAYICTKFCTVNNTMFHKLFCCHNSLLIKSKMAAAPFRNSLQWPSLDAVAQICAKFGTETNYDGCWLIACAFRHGSVFWGSQ